MSAPRLIADRGEFIDALHALCRGRVMVRVGGNDGRCLLDGAPLYSAHRTLLRYELVEPFDNPQGFPGVHYFRCSPRGREFAERACEAWRRRPLLERLAVRFAG